MDLKSEPSRRAYDNPLRDLTCQERNSHLFARLGVPRSIAASWLRRGPRAVVSALLLDSDRKELQARVLNLERRTDLLLALLRLLFGKHHSFGIHSSHSFGVPSIFASARTLSTRRAIVSSEEKSMDDTKTSSGPSIAICLPINFW